MRMMTKNDRKKKVDFSTNPHHFPITRQPLPHHPSPFLPHLPFLSHSTIDNTNVIINHHNPNLPQQHHQQHPYQHPLPTHHNHNNPQQMSAARNQVQRTAGQSILDSLHSVGLLTLFAFAAKGIHDSYSTISGMFFSSHNNVGRWSHFVFTIFTMWCICHGNGYNFGEQICEKKAL